MDLDEEAIGGEPKANEPMELDVKIADGESEVTNAESEVIVVNAETQAAIDEATAADLAKRARRAASHKAKRVARAQAKAGASGEAGEASCGASTAESTEETIDFMATLLDTANQALEERHTASEAGEAVVGTAGEAAVLGVIAAAGEAVDDSMTGEATGEVASAQEDTARLASAYIRGARGSAGLMAKFFGCINSTSFGIVGLYSIQTTLGKNLISESKIK
jgi:hypothetical protein